MCIMVCSNSHNNVSLNRFGPLRHHWCMRCEAKNSQLKQFVGRNFKNLPKTVADRHQYFMCMQLLSPPGVEATNFLYRGDEIHKGI